MRVLVPALLLLVAPAACGAADDAGPAAGGPPLAKATFAGGCFWCLEAAFDAVEGVVSTTAGYTGGRVEHPTYEQVSAGGTGHAEAVEVAYDPARVSYDRLLDVFWHNVDPTRADGQFCDRGTQYRSGIFWHDEEQRRQAEASKRRLEETRPFPGAVVTQIEPAGRFWPAEDRHQDYARRNPLRYQLYRAGCRRDRRLGELWGEGASR